MVREEKIKEVEELKKMIESYPVIGLLDIFKLPSRQFQEIRKKLRGKSLIKIVKKSLLKLAI
ncbi:MAG: 50S ribosomal protein L10, partial [Candidatus Heimdallarchaeota archaeon]